MRLVQVQVLRVREFDSRPLLSCLRYGVVGNMSGFHPVASGSIPGSGCFGESAAPLAQSVERETSNLEAAGSSPARGFSFSKLLQSSQLWSFSSLCLKK
jgi:hypothetical protein